MTFARPLALVVLVAIPTLVGLWIWLERRRHAGAARFTSPALQPNLVDALPGRRRLIPQALFILALTALIVGMARPHAHITVPRHEATVVLAIDVSRSMSATDVKPSRLLAAEDAANAFVDHVPRTYSLAVVAFATHAYVAVPPTETARSCTPPSTTSTTAKARRSATQSRSPPRSASGSGAPTARFRPSRCCSSPTAPAKAAQPRRRRPRSARRRWAFPSRRFSSAPRRES
ncbi:MAG TPA: VWA domain-containing protein [Gaiellaceae bacterium]|nr:VWA domain-containing protein [Gaiellaceae bacterium]